LSSKEDEPERKDEPQRHRDTEKKAEKTDAKPLRKPGNQE
jgi:hypothetical protein